MVLFVCLLQFESLFREIHHHLGDLLKRRRSGVIASLVSAAGRVGGCQGEVGEDLGRALGELPQWQGRTGEGGGGASGRGSKVRTLSGGGGYVFMNVSLSC